MKERMAGDSLSVAFAQLELPTELLPVQMKFYLCEHFSV